MTNAQAAIGGSVSERIERLERLDALRRMGALSDAEYVREKAKMLSEDAGAQQGVQPIARRVDEVVGDATSGFLTGIRRSLVSSCFGKNNALTLALVVVSALLFGLVLDSTFVAGLWLAVVSALSYWLYTGHRIEQKLAYGAGAGVWRVLCCAGCAVFVFSVIPLSSGGRSLRSTTPSASFDQVASAGLSSTPKDGATDSSTASRSAISCRSAMEIAAVASCGIALENLKAGDSLSFGLQSYKAQTGGYQMSLNQTMIDFRCHDAVRAGKNAAQAAMGDAWSALVGRQADMDTAVRMCSLNAKPAMDQFCEYNAATCSQ